MIKRCTKPNRKDYKHYGGRGITVCEQWLGTNGLPSFIKDMGNTFKDGLELDRIDVNGNYTPDNCRWATRREQVINRRPMGSGFDAHFLTFNGRTMCISQWADVTGLSSKVLADRIGKLKWSVEDTLTKPLRVNKSKSKGVEPNAQ